MPEETKVNLDLVKVFESELDDSLMKLKSLSFDGEECIKWSMRLIEHAYGSKIDGIGSKLKNGLNILSPFFVKNKGGVAPDVSQLTKDLFFAGNYYMLREYLYYTYNAPGSFQWDFSEKTVTIRFDDSTIPKQFFIEANNYLVRSKEIFEEYTTSDKILNLLTGVDEFVISPVVEEAISLIIEEADLKLKNYYNFVDLEEEINLGKYSYKEFYYVFRFLLIKALYHRYFAIANEIFTPIDLPFASLITEAAQDTDISEHICAEIIKDISYSADTAKQRIQPMYYSLYYLKDKGEIQMSPYDFAVWEGFINFFRIVALKNPKLFQDTISPILNKGFETNIKRMFSEQGFDCFRELKLSRFDKKLPDIDLLAISEELTLGYYAYFCEIKNPIPPQWAKDQLRVLNEDSVVKAFKQIDLIREFLKTDEGLKYFREFLPAKGLPHFGEEFVTVARGLIITSANSGMFFGNKEQAIINYNSLNSILSKSDGDVLYISKALEKIRTIGDDYLQIETVECQIGTKLVSYEGVVIKNILMFEQNEYRSIGLDKQLAKDFIDEGYHPFDTFRKAPK